MQWYIMVFIATFLYGIANIVDNFLSNKLFEKPQILIFYSYLFSVIFLPLLLFIGPIKIPPPALMIPIFIAGILQIIYLYPYYRTLQAEDTSVAISLFSIGQIFVPILAFIFIGERLKVYQYAGIALIVISSFALTHNKKMRFKRSLWLMLFSAFLVSCIDVLYKYTLSGVDALTVVFWSVLFAFIIITITVMITDRENLEFAKMKKNMKYFVIIEFMTLVAFILLIYGFSLAPVTLAKGIESTKPLMILFIAVIGKGLFPNLFREETSFKSIAKKSMFFILMIIGVIIILS